MAGGAGERFWPLSRLHYPKQLLKIAGNRSMLGAAVERIRPIIAPEDVFVITNRTLKPAIETEAGAIPPENVIAEPEGKNTAACLALAAALLDARYGPEEDVVMMVLTADHFIGDTETFRQDCLKAADFAEKNPVLVTFGIRPTRPETGYGYIEVGTPSQDSDAIFRVKSFREKPNLETACEFLDSGSFLWNSGMFVWRKSVIKEAFARFMPTLAAQVPNMSQGLAQLEHAEMVARAFSILPKISIDYGILEKADNVFVVKASFDWDDIGTWSSLDRLLAADEHNNVSFGNSHLLSCEDCIAYNSESGSEIERVVIGFNLQDTIIVNTPDAVLVLPKDASQKVKEVVAFLREKGLTQYL